MNNQFSFTKSCKSITKMKIRNFVLSIVSAASLGILTGCATIMGQSAAETLNVRSTPGQANVEILDESRKKVLQDQSYTFPLYY